MEKSIHTSAYQVLRRRLVEMRQAAGFTQRQLAAKLKRDQNLVARLEQGERRLDMVEFAAVAKACGTSPREMAWDFYSEIERGGRPLPGKNQGRRSRIP